jgi:hypothetical protein
MSKSELVEVTLEQFDFTFDVVKLAEDVVLDKLALLSTSTGLLSRIEYQNFLLTETVLNLERVFHFVAEASGGEPPVQIEIRNLIVDKVVSINPSFDPTLLVINKSGVIKPSILGDGTPLTLNADWDKVLGTDVINPYVQFESVEITDDPEEEDDDEPPPLPDPLEIPSFSMVNVPTESRLWKRTNLNIEVRKFAKQDVPALFPPRLVFPDEQKFQTYVITITIPNIPSLYQIVDQMGLVELVGLDVVIKDLFDLCLDVNPFFKFAEVLDISKLKDLKKVDPPVRRAGKRSKKTERKSDREFKSVSKEDLLSLADRMKSKIVGQGDAIDQIVETIQVASCGLRDPEKPVAVYMLCGKTGTGKTLTAKVLAEELCGSRDAIVRIDCSEYTEQHSIQKLIGAPPSYVGYEDGGFLTNAVQEHPFSIVLFDEIEKAHNKLFDVLLQIMDDARLTDGKGNVTSFKDCIILLTSNIGVAESEAVKGTMGFGDDGILTEARRDEALKKALKARFRPEFLNRIDSSVNFRSLSKEDGLVIVGLLLAKINGYLEKKDITAEFTDAIKEMVFAKGFSSKYGARPLERTIEKEVVKPLAQMLLKEEIKEGSTIKIDYKKDKVVVKEIKKPSSPRRSTSVVKV